MKRIRFLYADKNTLISCFFVALCPAYIPFVHVQASYASTHHSASHSASHSAHYNSGHLAPNAPSFPSASPSASPSLSHSASHAYISNGSPVSIYNISHASGAQQHTQGARVYNASQSSSQSLSQSSSLSTAHSQGSVRMFSVSQGDDGDSPPTFEDSDQEANVPFGNNNAQQDDDSQPLTPSGQTFSLGAMPAHKDLSGPNISSYKDLLSKIQKMKRNAMLMKAQIDQKKMQMELQKADNDLKKSQAKSADSTLISSGTDRKSFPQVVALMGIGKKETAILNIPRYGEFPAKNGDVLVNGWRIKSVTYSGVEAVTKTGVIVALPYGGQ